MDNHIVIQKKKISDYLPVWLTNIHSMFYYFLFLVILGVLFFATSLFVNYFTTPYTGDYTAQQFAFYTNGYDDWWHFITTGEFVLYDQNTFLGADNIGSNSFYYLFDPFFLPILLVPRQLIPQGMALLTIFKIAACGMTFFLYMRYMGASRTASKISGIAYAFCGWVAWNLWFNHFTDVAIVLPLILLGIELTIKEKKPWALAGALCLMGFVNFFFLVCFALCGFLYAMFRYFQTLNTRTLNDNLIVLGFGFLGFFIGILMPMMVVFPAAMHSITSPRASSNTYSSYLVEAFKAHNLKKVFQLLTSWNANYVSDQNKARVLYPFIEFIYPVTSCRGTPLTVLGNESYDNAAGSLFCFIPIISLLTPAFMDSLNKKHFSVLVPLAFFVIGLFTPFLYYAFHGFTNVAYSRWTLFFAACLIGYVGLYLDKVKEAPTYHIIIGCAVSLIFSVVGGVTAFYIVKTYNQNFTERVPIWLAMVLEAVYILIFGTVICLVITKKKPKFYGTFTGFIAFELILMGAFVIQGHGVEDYYYTNKGVWLNDTLHSLVEKTKRNDKSYYRSYSSLGSDDASNDPMRNGFNGVNMFHSVYNFNTADFCNWTAITNGTSPGSWSGNYVQKRINLDTVLGIKYYYVEDDYFVYQNRAEVTSEKFRYNVPLNYLDVTDSYKNSYFRVYKNMDYIDFALTYDTIYTTTGDPMSELGDYYTIYDKTYGKNSLTIEEFMMQAAIVNTKRDETLASYIDANYPSIFVKEAPSKYLDNYYKILSWDKYSPEHPTSTYEATFTYYDMFSKDRNSLGLTAKEYLDLCRRDNDTFDKYGDLPADNSGYRRWVIEIDSNYSNFPNYDPNGNIYYINSKFEWSHEVDIYFVDTNNQIVTYDNHNDGYYSCNSQRGGKQYRAFYIAPEYELNENGELVISKPAPKIKKIILATRGGKVQSSYSVYIDTYTKHKAKMDKLKQYVVTDVKSSANTYKFKTNFDKNRVVVTRLAYEDGFKLKMTGPDGKKQNLKVFNGQGGFVSFISGAGECSYKLEFVTPYLQLASYVSAATTFFYLTSFVGCFYLELRKQERDNLFLFQY